MVVVLNLQADANTHIFGSGDPISVYVAVNAPMTQMPIFTTSNRRAATATPKSG